MEPKDVIKNKFFDGLDQAAQILYADRVLLDHGLVSETIQQNLFFYGTIASPLIRDVEIDVDVDKKILYYKLYLSRWDLAKYRRYLRKLQKYADPKTLLGKYLKLRLLRKAPIWNIEKNLKMHLSVYAPNFSVSVEVLDARAKKQD